MAKVHFCGHSGCHEIIPFEERYCSKHVKEHEFKKENIKMTKIEKSIILKNYNEFERNPEANSFYHSTQWQRIRDYVYSRDEATCQVCGNVINNIKIVDHIHALKLAPDEKLDSNNLWVLCYRCHAIKTKGEQKIASGLNGTNKLKHINKEWWIKYINERIKNEK